MSDNVNNENENGSSAIIPPTNNQSKNTNQIDDFNNQKDIVNKANPSRTSILPDHKAMGGSSQK